MTTFYPLRDFVEADAGSGERKAVTVDTKSESIAPKGHEKRTTAAPDFRVLPSSGTSLLGVPSLVLSS